MAETNTTNHEIDVIDIICKVFKHWISLLLFLVIFGALGVFVALDTPKEYTTSVVLAPEMSSGAGVSSSLSDLASNFGVDLGGGGSSIDAIYPEIYPDIFSSTDFKLTMFDIPVRLINDEKIRTYKQHLQKDTKSTYWSVLKAKLMLMLSKPEKDVSAGGPAGEYDPYRLSRKDSEMCETIGGAITCFIDKQTNEISIDVTDQDPMVAAIIADTLQRRLQNYITEYRTKKSRVDCEYYKKLAADAKEQYEKSQKKYAAFCDANVDAILEEVNSQRDQLENEMQLNYNHFTQMEVQLKAAEAKIQERTPAFTIIQNAYIAHRPSGMSRTMRVLIFLVIGFILDVFLVLIRMSVKKNKPVVKAEVKAPAAETMPVEATKSAETEEKPAGTTDENAQRKED